MMKKVLITGANSYIGTSFEKYMNHNYPGEFQIDTVDMIDGSWREKDFSSYDTVFHVAGIAHADTSKVSKEDQKKYYAINTDLTIETANKARNDGVKQFVFMSSIIVYGESGKAGEVKVITKDTLPHPANFYGDSKLKAEEGIRPLDDTNFHVAVLRPPMIYGPGSKGNYPRLSKLAQKLPAFPYVNNKRSMIYIENLCEFIHSLVLDGKSGTFFPQNKEYVNTSNLVKLIAKAHGKDIKIISGFSPSINLAGEFTELVNKAFGSIVYDKSLSGDIEQYSKISLGRSIARTESKKKPFENLGNKTKKHILVVTQYFFPEQFRINDICREWVKRGYEVTVLTGIPNYPSGKFFSGYGLHENRKEHWEGINIIRIPIIPRGSSNVTLIMNYISFVASGMFWNLVSDIKADHVFIFEVSPMTQALPGVWYAKKQNVPCYLYVQDLWPENLEIIAGVNDRLIIESINSMVDYIYAHCQRIFTTSAGFVESIAKHGIDQERIIVWPQYAEDYCVPLQNKYIDRPFTLMFTGNIGEGQGLDVLIEAASILCKKDISDDEIRFVIVGDGRYKNTLLKKIDESHCSRYFDIRERIQPEKVPEVLSECDVAFLSLKDNPILDKTIPAKLQTYMACGKPILACASGETKYLVEISHCGFCVASGNAMEMVDALLSLQALPEDKLSKMGNNAREFALQHFNKQQLMDEMDKYLGAEQNVYRNI